MLKRDPCFTVQPGGGHRMWVLNRPGRVAAAVVLAGSAVLSLSGCDVSGSVSPISPRSVHLPGTRGATTALGAGVEATTGPAAAGPVVGDAGTAGPGTGGIGPRPVIASISSGRVVTLTFDDGPGPFTGPILDVLDAEQLHATFCQIGEQVGDYPDIEHRIAAAGDVLCDHSWDHDEQLPTRPVSVIDAEIDRTQTAIRQATGQTPVFYRAPAGNWGSTLTFLGLLAGKQLLPLGWAVDSEDWTRPGVNMIVANVMSQVTPGAVILLHDGGGDRSQTLTALPILIKQLRHAGYRITAMPPPHTF